MTASRSLRALSLIAIVALAWWLFAAVRPLPRTSSPSMSSFPDVPIVVRRGADLETRQSMLDSVRGLNAFRLDRLSWSHGSLREPETEDLEVRKLPLDEAIAMVMRGEITDAISAAALLRISSSR